MTILRDVHEPDLRMRRRERWGVCPRLTHLGFSQLVRVRRDPFARDLLFDPGRAGMASLSGPVHVAFDSLHGLRSCDVPITGLNHTPHATAVYASWPASPSAHATLASRLPAGHYLGRTFTD